MRIGLQVNVYGLHQQGLGFFVEEPNKPKIV